MFARLIILTLTLAASVFAQAKTTTAAKAPINGILIDGVLDEYFWTSDLVGEKIKIDNSMVTDGVIDGDGDCYAQFKTLWNENGFYIGTWYYDDIHNAVNSQYLDAANIAYDDDGLEYFIDYNFDDAWNSSPASPALYFLQLVKGFGNLAPETQYGGWWGGDDGSGKGWSTAYRTVNEQQSMGWHEVFTSVDGVNFTTELLIEWSGSIMHEVGSMNEGGAIAFDMKVNDNDGAFTIEGAMHWTGVSHQGEGYSLHWGKVYLGGLAGIRPVAASTMRMQANSGNAVYDILGRKIVSKSPISTVRIHRSNTAAALRKVWVK